jgi:regulator of cell morphogenesis and NO signaling
MTTNNPLHLSTEQSVGDWVTADYRLATVFDKYGIDFCCGGQKPVAEACAEQGVSPDAILLEVDKVSEAPGSGERYDEWALDFLADYIVNQFHIYTKKMLPQLSEYVDTVANVHGEAHPETRAIADLWPGVRGELAQHMQKEELMLFPYIKRLVQCRADGAVPPVPPFGSVRALVDMMEAEHDATGGALHQIEALSDGYTPPADACPTYETLYALLREFDAATKKHIHLENNVLFPKAVELEESLRAE